MNKCIGILTIIGLLISVSSCLKEELPVPEKDRGEAVTSSVSMEQDYRYQIWYSLERDTIVSKNLKTEWDIRFSSAENRVTLNSSRAMMAYYTGETDWVNIQDTAGFYMNRTIDKPSGSLDSTAMGDIVSNQGIYVINMGYDWAGQHLGYYKLRFTNVSNSSYTMEFSELDNTTPQSVNIETNTDYHFSYFSMLNQQKVSIEPRRSEYDLLISQYTHIFYEPFSPYLVTGVLTNPDIQTGELYPSEFGIITADDTTLIEMKDAHNVIGYDWKDFSFDTNDFTVFPEKVYMLKTATGYLYKLHFIDFYDENGVKGAPTFVYQAL